MRKLKIIEHISLDGVIQHSADDGDFPYSDWTAPYRTPAGRDAMLAAYGGSFDLLLGRRTYDIWSGFWPKAPSSPMADGLNAAKKFIATHRPESLESPPRQGCPHGPFPPLHDPFSASLRADLRALLQ
jgi:dihydrofolate reductase